MKAFIHGFDSAALDDVFELLAWNQGIGYFSSEIGLAFLGTLCGDSGKFVTLPYINCFEYGT